MVTNMLTRSSEQDLKTVGLTVTPASISYRADSRQSWELGQILSEIWSYCNCSYCHEISQPRNLNLYNTTLDTYSNRFGWKIRVVHLPLLSFQRLTIFGEYRGHDVVSIFYRDWLNSVLMKDSPHRFERSMKEVWKRSFVKDPFPLLSKVGPKQNH